ncbi:hypothetical protein DRQ09_05160, partial [candidate division KSB1 bacterium]
RFSNVETIDSIQQAAYSYLSQIILQGDLDKTDRVIQSYGLPSDEVKEVAKEVITNLLRQERFKLVYEVMMKFKISPDDPDLKDSAERAIEKCMQSGYYETAADLGFIFEIKNQKVKSAAKIVWQECMKKEEFKKAKIIKKKHRLTKKDTKKTAEEVYKTCLDRNKLEIAKNIRKEYNLKLDFFTWLLELIKKILLWLGGGKESTQEE